MDRDRELCTKALRRQESASSRIFGEFLETDPNGIAETRLYGGGCSLQLTSLLHIIYRHSLITGKIQGVFAIFHPLKSRIPSEIRTT